MHQDLNHGVAMKTMLIATLLLLTLAGCEHLAEAHQSVVEKPAAKPVASPTQDPKPAAGATTVDATENGQTWSCAVEGMHCAGCAATVQQALKALPGVEDAQVDLEGKSATVKMKVGASFPEAQARDKLEIDNYKLGQCQPVKLTN